jgi:hypothetical protein
MHGHKHAGKESLCLRTLGRSDVDLDHGKSPGLCETNAGYVLRCGERNETGREKMERRVQRVVMLLTMAVESRVRVRVLATAPTG